MNKGFFAKVISIVVMITLILNTAFYPVITALAETDIDSGVKETTQIEDPEPSTTETPAPTPTDAPKPTEDTQEEFEEFTPVQLSVEAMLDENGFLTDEALEMLQPLPCEEEKFTEITELGDGKYGMKLFMEPIKFQNDDGEYETIDNSIVAIDDYKDAKHRGSNYKFKNNASDIEILMSDSLDETNAIEMNFQGYSIGFKPLNLIKKSNQENNINFIVDENPIEKSPDRATTNPRNQQSSKENKNSENNKNNINQNKTDQIRHDEIDGSIVYESIEYTETFSESIDIQITPTTTGLKEDIILYEIPKQTEFSYEFNVENVVPMLRQDGNLYFVDVEKGLLVAAIAAPFMFDSKEEYSESYDIKVTLEQIGENTYKYTLIPDRSFLENENTVYPVVIDPALNTWKGIIADTFTTSRYSNNNYVNDPDLKVGYGSDLQKSRGMVKFVQWPISQTGYHINYVLYCAYQNYSGSSTPIIQIAECHSDWNPSTVKWSNQPSSFSVVSQQTVQAVGWYYWDVTNLFARWFYGQSPNYGMYVKSSDENSNKYKRFYSENSGTAPNYFYIEYTDPAPSMPSISTSPNATSTWTNNKNPVLYWSGASDAGSGLNRVEYSINGGSWVSLGAASSGSRQITLSSSGTHVISARCVDNAGNVGGTSTLNYRLDISAPNTPPPPTVTVTNGALNSGSSATITISFAAVADNPTGKGNASYYHVYMKKGTETEISAFSNISAGTYTLSNQEDFTTYQFRIVAYDNFGQYSASGYTSKTTEDRTGPVINAQSNVAINTSGWTNNTNPTITWGAISDKGGGTTELKYQINSTTGVWRKIADYSAHTGTIDCRDLLDGEYKIYVKAFDAKGNSSNTVELDYKKDTTPPDVTILGEDGDVAPIPGNALYYIQAAASDLNLASWTIDYAFGTSPVENDFTDNVIESGTTELDTANPIPWDLSGLNINRPYTLRVTAKDEANNKTVVKLIVYYALDAEKIIPKLTLKIIDVSTEQIIDPNSDITASSIGGIVETDVTGILSNRLYVNDALVDTAAADERLSFNPLEYNNGWVYPEGSQVFLRAMAQDADGNYYFSNTTYQGHKIIEIFNDEDNLENQLSNYTNIGISNDSIRLIDTSSSGHIISTEQTINGLVYYATLRVDEDKPGNSNIRYYLIHDGGEQEIFPNVNTPLNIPTNKCKVKAVLTSSDSLESPRISHWGLDVSYIYFSSSRVINNSFVDNARGFCNLTDVVHDGANGGSIKLKSIVEYPTYMYKTSGSVQSTVRITPGEVWEAFLSVDETKSSGTNITYKVSVDGGVNWQTIIPGSNPNEDEQWLPITYQGNEVILKAELTGDGTNTPSLNSWSLQCRQTLTGQAYDIQLIDAPDNLSTLVDANYMTLLRWDKSETEGVVYRIHRSETPYFEPSDDTVIRTTSHNFWSDYNLQFDKKFYYKVTAVKEFIGSDSNLHLRESLPSNEAWAQTVSEGELNKKLGLQDYWSFYGFQTGGGSGYVNISDSNLVYKSTDLIVSDSFLASVMARTYNSMANTKTPMGYGWDYSFNTCLLKVYDSSGENVEALVLKDGDGSFHRFDYDEVNGVYLDAKGTFMKLSEVYNSSSELTGYTIKRKDDITYYFDAGTMKLDKFTDNNGTTLDFIYDYEIDDGDDGVPDRTDRGNLVEILSSVGEKITLSYYVDGSEPQQGDYMYINNNVDLLASVTWTEDTQNDPESVTYTYIYNDNDKLESVNASIGEENLCVETFRYDVDIDGDDQTSDHNFVIADAEDRITTVSTNYKGEVATVYDPIKVSVGDTDPVLSNYFGDYYSFILYDWGSDGTNDTTVIRNNYNAYRQYDYNEYGSVYMKTDYEFGLTYHYSHNDNHQTTSVRYDNTFNGVMKTVLHQYTYDDNGNIEQVKAFEKAYGESFYTPLEPETNYTYCPSHPNKVETMSVKKDDSSWVVTSYTYDANGNMLTTTVADSSVDSNGTPIEKTTHYTYYSGEAGGLQWQLKSVKDEFGSKTRYEYDSKGRLVAQKQYDAGNNYVRTVAAYTYDGFSRTDTMTQPYVENGSSNPLVTDMDYDEFGRLKRMINPDGTAEERVYDKTGLLIRNTVGHMSGSEFIEENRTTYQYDSLGRMISATIGNDPTTSSDDATSTIVYGHWDYLDWLPGDNAEKITRTDALGVQTIEYYDSIGRLVKTQVSDGSAYITTAQYTYDLIGNVIQAKDNAGTITKAYYNALNQQIRSVVDPFDSTDGKDNMNVEKLYSYDYLGNTTEMTEVVFTSESNQANPKIITTKYDFDDLSRLSKVSQNNPNFGIGNEPEFIETSYFYDNRVTLNGDALIMNYKRDPLGYINETYFDELGRTAISFNKGDTSDGDDAPGKYQKTTFAYDDALFQTQTVTRTDGTREEYTYDDVGRVLRIDYYENGASTSSEYIEYVYNELGQVLTESTTNGIVTHQTSYLYDRMGRTRGVWEGTYTDNGDPDKAPDGLDIEYTYNNVGQVTVINYNTSTGGEHDLVYIYDDFGRISEIQLDPIPEVDDNTVRKYTYDAQTGVLLYTRDYREFATVSATLGDYIQTDYAYNSAGLVNQITYSDAAFIDANNAEGITERHIISYDGRGYIDAEQQDTDYSKDLAVAMKTVYKAYDYDSLGRLTKSGSGDNAAASWEAWTSLTQYTYDLDGNRKSMDNRTDVFTYSYNQFNQLTNVAKNGVTYQTYQYDLRGNQTKEIQKDYLTVTVNDVETKHDKTTTFRYNLRNQMSGATISAPVPNESTGVVTFEDKETSNLYNAGGQRMKKYEEDDNDYAEDDTTKYFYTGTAQLYTTNAANELMTENILDPGGQIIASKRFDDDGDLATPYQYADQYFFYNYDMRGSVTNIVGPDGELITGYEYDEFGNRQQSGDTSFLNEVTFTGSVSDLSTGLQYMNARFYDSKSGRFISQDTYTGNPYEPWTQHLYSYCMNNPTSFIDPTGHSAYIAYEYMMRAKKQIEAKGGTAGKSLLNSISYAKMHMENGGKKSGSGSSKSGSGSSSGAASWWNTVPESSFTVPSTDQVISNIGASVFGGSLSSAGNTISNIQTNTNWVMDSDRYVTYIPGRGTAVYKHPKLGKAVNKVAGVVTVVTTGMDVANTWTENNGNTNGQRVAKSAIQVGGTALSVAAGIGVFAAVNAWNPVGWGAAVLAGVIAVGALVGSSFAINSLQEEAYEALDIK